MGLPFDEDGNEKLVGKSVSDYSRKELLETLFHAVAIIEIALPLILKHMGEQDGYAQFSLWRHWDSFVSRHDLMEVKTGLKFDLDETTKRLSMYLEDISGAQCDEDDAG